MTESTLSRIVRRGRRVDGTRTWWVLGGALLSGLGAYGFQVVGAHGLGEEDFAPISVLWTLQYLSLSVPLIAIETYLTRSFSARDLLTARAHQRVMASWIVVIASVTAVITYAWRDQLVDGHGELAAVAGLIVLAYGLVVLARGEAAGREVFRSYAIITGAESMLRLAVAAPVALLVSTTRALAWTLPIGPALAGGWWYLTRPPRSVLASGGAGSVLPADSPTQFLASTVVANGAAQVLLAGGPLVLAALGAPARDVSIFFVTITAARIPIVLAYGGLLSRVLPPLLRVTRRGNVRRLRQIVLVVSGSTGLIALVAAGVASLLGAALVARFFGASFRPPDGLAVAAAAGVVLASGAMLIGQVIIAQAGETRLMLPWLTALGAAAAVVAGMGGDPTRRLAVGLVVGECCALLALALTACVWRPRRDGRPPPAPPSPVKTVRGVPPNERGDGSVAPDTTRRDGTYARRGRLHTARRPLSSAVRGLLSAGRHGPPAPR